MMVDITFNLRHHCELTLLELALCMKTTFLFSVGAESDLSGAI